jgi:hypothetical protein
MVRALHAPVVMVHIFLLWLCGYVLFAGTLFVLAVNC